MARRDEIGAHEARTRLPELLRRVKAGGRFVITQRGKAVAELVPVQSAQRVGAARAARRMRAFMRKHLPIHGANSRALIDEGRD